MATTIASLFRRPKSLSSILSGLTKYAAELDEFVAEATSDIAGINEQIDDLTAHRSIAVDEIARATRTKAKIADLYA